MTKLEAAALANPGREREFNEDRVWAQVYAASEQEPIGLFIVCDGIGGHMGGEVASHWAVEAIKHELADLFYKPDPRATVQLPKEELDAILEGDDPTRLSDARKIEARIVQAIRKANQVVYDYAQQKPKKAADAGTTVTMAVVNGSRAIIANVGDSRTYLIRDGVLRRITKDHSLVASLVASGKIQPEEVYSHPQRNLIFRSLGQKRNVEVDTYWEVLNSGDTMLLCSDGLWEMVQDENIMAKLIKKSNTPDQACQMLVEAANTAGGEDNIGVVVVRVI